MALYRKITIGKFPKGITDKPEDGDILAAEKLENGVLRDNATFQTRDGSWILEDYAYRTPNQKDGKLILEYDGDKVILAGANAYIDNGTTLTQKQGVNTDIEVFPDADSDNYFSHIEWKDQFIVTSNQPGRPTKIFKEDTRGWQIITEGLPALTGDPTVSVTGGSGTHSFIAGFCYKYDYSINNIDYTMRGPITTVQVNGQTDVGTVNYTNIPALGNGSDTHYDLTNIDIEIYRTVEDGTVLHLDTTIDNGTTSVSTSVTGSGITANARAYTDGGVLNNTPPPKCKYITKSQNYVFYLNTEDDPAQGIQAKPNQPYACPATNTFEADEKITGGAIAFDDAFIGTNYKVYRLDGRYSTLGTGTVSPKEISNADGILYHQSIDNGSYGFFAAGLKSFVFCDGNKVVPVCDFDELYKIIRDNSSDTNQIVGAFDRVNKRMLFSCQQNSASSQNDSIFVFHEKIWLRNSEYKPFTTWKTGKYFAPTYIQFLNNNDLFRGENNGYLFKHNDSYKYDPQYKAGTLPASWNKLAVKEDIISSFLFGPDPSVRNWGIKVYTRARNLTNLSIQPSVAQDGMRNFKPMNKIDVRTQIVWGEEHLYWGIMKDSYWNDKKEIRRMTNTPSGFARFYSRQLRYQRAFSIIYTPDMNYASTVTVEAGANTIRFNGTVPNEILEKYIFFAPDYAQRFYIIRSIDNNTYQVSDPNGQLVSGTYSWIIKGFPIRQTFNLLEGTIFFIPYGESGNYNQQNGIEANG
jgi:hypothetical protein